MTATAVSWRRQQSANTRDHIVAAAKNLLLDTPTANDRNGYSVGRHQPAPGATGRMIESS